MTRLYLTWLTLAAMCILLVFKVDLNSDLLFLDSLAVDLFAHGGAWSNWKITPAPAYFPDMLAYALAYFVFPNPTQRVIFVCVVQALLLAWACIYLARTIKPSFSTNARMSVLLITTAVVLVAANSSMWLFFNSTNNHFSALFFPILCLGWIITFLKSKRLPALLLTTCGVALGAASTSIFTLAFTAPALAFLAGCILVFRAHRHFCQDAFQIGSAIVIGQGISVVLQKILLSFNALEGRPLFTLEAALHSITAFVSATIVTFGTDNQYTLALAVFLTVCIVWVLIDWLLSVRLSIHQPPTGSPTVELEFPGKNWAYGLCVAFWLVAFPVNVIGAILSGGFGDYAGYRYFTFPITLGGLLWILMLDFKSVFDSRRAALASAFLLVILACLGLFSVKPLLHQSNRTSYAEAAKKGIRDPVDTVGECIDREAKKGFVFGAGIADFWNARGLSYKTEKPLYVLPVVNNATPFFHMMSVGPLTDPKKYSLQSFNFVVMRKSGTTTQFDLTPETLGRVLPSPARTVSCENSDSELWLYTDTGLDTVVRHKTNQFLGQQGVLQNYQMSGYELSGNVGKVQSQSRVAEAGIDAAGFLTYGPYITVPAGRYQGVIFYIATEPGNKWDAGRFDNPEKLANMGAGAIPIGQGKVAFSFETSQKISNFEIRTWFGGRGTFTIEKITLQPVPSR